MNMGQASKATGVSNKLIRYHESVGLIRPADRTGSHYRDFGDRDARELQFIRRARDRRVPVEEIGHLLSFWRDRDRPGREAEAIARKHFADLDARISEMQAMAGALRRKRNGPGTDSSITQDPGNNVNGTGICRAAPFQASCRLMPRASDTGSMRLFLLRKICHPQHPRFVKSRCFRGLYAPTVYIGSNALLKDGEGRVAASLF
jgi:DNA-binding transcriptional MerR regulator